MESEIQTILWDACQQVRTLRERNAPGDLGFWSFVQTYAEVALDVAQQHRDVLDGLDPATVFSPPALRQPRLRPFLASYDLHRYLYLNALVEGRPAAILETLRACDAVIHQVFLGFPEPGYLGYPGLLGYLADPEEELEDIRLQEAFLLRRLEMPRAEAADHLARLRQSLAAYLPRAAQVPSRSPVPPADPEPSMSYSVPKSPTPAPTRGGPLPPPPPKRGLGKGDAPPGAPAAPDEPASARPDPGHYRVWYATTRRPVSEDSAREGYAAEADPQERVHHGYCDVLIPESHAFGSVGSSWLKRWLRPWQPDDRLRIEQVARLDEAIFLRSVRRELRALDPAERVALVYIHGYRTSFDEAAIRAAQIGFDLKVPGITAFFSWHSRGELDDYLADGEAIQEAEEPLRQFLLQFATQVDAEKVHLIAHSMGNQGLARAIQGIAEQVTEESGKPFAQILLAAPDIGQALFRRLARAYPKVSERTTLYISARDKALQLSRWLQDTPRAGFTPPVTVVDDIDTVEVTDIDLTLLGHGYFAAAEPVLYDMSELIHDGKPPERRLRVRQTPGPPPHWVIAK